MNIKNPKYQTMQDKRSIAGTFFINLVNKNTVNVAQIVEKMIDGRLKKFYEETCLMEQPFVKNPDQTITDLINEAVLKIGEKITVRRFVRYEMGEGLEKRVDNFAEEVMSQVNGTTK